jgi:hypothetical protein
LREGILDVGADRATQRPGPEIGVESLVNEEVLGGLVEFELHALGFEAMAHLLQFNLDDVVQVVA